MNPELKQRLIGAAVVTALATIFVPMLFDDHADTKDKIGIEEPMKIPPEPLKSPEVSANKVPAPASKPAKTPDVATDETIAPSEDVTEDEMVDDALAEANAGEASVNGTAPVQGTDPVAEADKPVVEKILDTGEVPAATPIIKKIPPIAVTPTAPKSNNVTIKKTEATTPKQLPVTKPVEATPPKPVVKTNPPKPLTPSPVVTTAPVQPKKPELIRYTIVAGSFNQLENANKLMKSLREQGIPVNMETNPPGSNAKYRLKIGTSLDKKKAEAYKDRLDKQGVQNAMIPE